MKYISGLLLLFSTAIISCGQDKVGMRFYLDKTVEIPLPNIETHIGAHRRPTLEEVDTTMSRKKAKTSMPFKMYLSLY